MQTDACTCVALASWSHLGLEPPPVPPRDVLCSHLPISHRVAVGGRRCWHHGRPDEARALRPCSFGSALAP
eukprot:4884134-Alexandrium_andersonii.AAC.1